MRSVVYIVGIPGFNLGFFLLTNMLLNNKQSKDFITTALLNADWSKKDINDMFKGAKNGDKEYIDKLQEIITAINRHLKKEHKKLQIAYENSKKIKQVYLTGINALIKEAELENPNEPIENLSLSADKVFNLFAKCYDAEKENLKNYTS